MRPQDDPHGPHFDPWRNWHKKDSSASTTATRVVPGPTETRLAAQDEKIAVMQQAIQQLQTDTKTIQSDTKKGFDEVLLREKHVHEAIHKVRSELEVAFTSALSKQSNQLNETLSDLKSLLKTKTKRDRGKEEGDMSE